MLILITLSFHSKNLPRSKNVVRECLMKFLYGKTFVYGTHQLEFLEAAYLNLVMKDGKIVESGSSVFILGRTVLMATVAVETAQCLFHGMIKSVFKAPVSFFDTTPSSQILSRSSTDQSTVDTNLPY
ncbi:multidrug resistance-associated protein [Trifolium repens]|nr:multidrug resistance-associated protein [Trifolium repens]